MAYNNFDKERQKKIEARCNLKDKQIAYFNSVNSSIALLGKGASKKDLIEWRNWFISEWQEWYLNNVPVYKTPAEIADLKEQHIADLAKEEALKEEEKEVEESLPIILEEQL